MCQNQIIKNLLENSLYSLCVCECVCARAHVCLSGHVWGGVHIPVLHTCGG